MPKSGEQGQMMKDEKAEAKDNSIRIKNVM